MAKVEMNIDDEKIKDWKKNWNDKKCGGHHHHHGNAAGGGAVYGLGLIGALVYFWQHANSFWSVIMGLLKAIVWPAILVWHFLSFLKIQ